MARTQADNYGERRAEIVERAAHLFAERGFRDATIGDLAKACGTSKSLLYHYYQSKEDILFDVMHSHVQALLVAAERLMEKNKPANDTLYALTLEFMRLYLGAASRQRVLLNELKQLPPKRRRKIVDTQRRLIDIVATLLVKIRPELARQTHLQKPTTMLYFGMINWMHTWLNPSGDAKPERIAELAISIFLSGFTNVELHT
jgi:AcrR family transcriptional regulator